MDNCPAIEKQISEHLKVRKMKVVIDCSKIQYIYSSGIGLLIRLRNLIFKNEGSVWLVNVSASCRENLRSLQLEKIFSIYSTDVEFELSQNEIWEEEISKDAIHFVCIHQQEGAIYRIALVGKFIAANDVSSFRNIKYSESVSRYAFDLTGLEMVDSHGIYLLLNLIHSILKNNAKCCAFGANAEVSELFSLCAIDELLTLCENETEALQFLQS